MPLSAAERNSMQSPNGQSTGISVAQAHVTWRIFLVVHVQAQTEYECSWLLVPSHSEIAREAYYCFLMGEGSVSQSKGQEESLESELLEGFCKRQLEP